MLRAASPYFPPGTIFAAVVDPGVGSERRIIAVRTSRASYVGPDNGVLSWALQHEDVQETINVTQSEYWLPDVSRTFHGRDIFAPVAAHLALGLPISHLGDPVEDPILLPLPAPRLESVADRARRSDLRGPIRESDYRHPTGRSRPPHYQFYPVARATCTSAQTPRSGYESTASIQLVTASRMLNPTDRSRSLAALGTWN